MADLILTENDLARFKRYLRPDPDSGCLLWTGSSGPYGHGYFSLRGKSVPAHRVAFILGGGILTEEMPFVLHDCPLGDNPACCEFLHLEAGNSATNQSDMARKDRGIRSKKGLPFGVYVLPDGRLGTRIRVRGKRIYLGTYDDLREAAEAALRAKKEAYGL